MAVSTKNGGIQLTGVLPDPVHPRAVMAGYGWWFPEKGESSLDDFVLKDGQLVFRGWDKHIKPRLSAVKNILRKKGFEAENVGWL